MRFLLHSILLAIAVFTAGWGFGVVAFPAVVGAGAVACLALRGQGLHWQRLIVFLTSVALFVVGGLAVGAYGYFPLLIAVLLAAVFFVWATSACDDAEFNAPGSLAFYASLALAFLYLSDFPAGWTLATRVTCAVLALAVGLSTWGVELPVKRLRRTATEEGRRPIWVSLATVVALLGVLALAFWRPLPWAGEKAVVAGERLREALPMLDIFGKSAGPSGDGEGKFTGDNLGQADGSGFGMRHELPSEGQLDLGSESMLFVQIQDRAEFIEITRRQNYVRSMVLERYIDGGWEQADGGGFLEDSDDGLADGWVRFGDGQGIRHEVFLPGAGGRGLPALQNAIAFRLGFLIQAAPDQFEAELRGAVHYSAESRPLDWREVGRRRPEPARVAASDLVMERAGGHLGGRLRELATSLVATARTPAERLDAIQNYLLENCSYATRVEASEGMAPLENFLFGDRVGWCDFFASAAVLLAREAGFPSRLAVGYSAGEAFPSDQLISYRASDAHAWAEVKVDGLGWVVFDTTPPGQGAARSPAQSGVARRPDLSEFRAAESDTPSVGQGDREGFWSRPGWLDWALAVLAGLLVAGVALHIARRKESDGSSDAAGSAAGNRANLPAYLREFLRVCREFGRPKGRGETLRETVAGLDAIGVSGAELTEVADYHYGITYEENPRDRGRESDIKRALRALRKRAAAAG